MGGLDSLKKAASGKTAGKKKTGVPTVHVSDPVGQAIQDFRAAKKKEKDAKAELADAEERMMEEASSARIRKSREEGENLASINISGGGETIMFTQKGQFKKMAADEASDKIRAVVGAKQFDAWFKTRTTFSFNAEALEALPNSDEIFKAIAAALGKHASLLQCEAVLVPTDAYADAITLDEKASKQAEKLQALGLAVPYKGSFK